MAPTPLILFGKNTAYLTLARLDAQALATELGAFEPR
jgi:hypothetical protein